MVMKSAFVTVLSLASRCAPRGPTCSADADADPQRLASAVDSIVDGCREWIREHVIRLGLCPFASQPFVAEQIRYAVTDATTNEELVEEFFVEGRLLLDTPSEELATTMLIAPDFRASIDDFFDLYEWLTAFLEDEGEELLENKVQPAFFHPQWNFDGLTADSPIHFEKRAPMPVINLLRRADLDSVVEQGLANGRVVNRDIAEHNAAALEAEGFDALTRAFLQYGKHLK